jgi:hypothetical protein
MRARFSLVAIASASFLSAAILCSGDARAVNINYTGLGDGTSWTDLNNWVEPVSHVPQLPTASDQAFIDDTFTVNINSAVTVGSFSIGHDSGVARLNIQPGALFTVNGTTRIGRGATSIGGARGEVFQTGGTVNFPNGSRLGLTFDSRTPPEVNADSLYVINGGTLTLAGSGSIQIGRTLDSGGNPISFNRAEFRVAGSGATLIEANRLSLDGGGAQGTPVLGFEIDSGGVTRIRLRDWLRLNQSATLEVRVNSPTVPTGDITLLECDFFTTGALTEFVGRPEGSVVSAISSANNRLFEWTLDYNNASDDGVIDSFVKLTNVHSFRGGDANKDGSVNLSDFNILASNFGTGGHTWTTADFTGDALVNLSDFNVLATNFGLSGLSSNPTPQDWANLRAAVPEPSALLVVAAGALWVVMSRRRRSH